MAALLKSRPVALIRDGQINQHALCREFMNREELMAELRMHRVTDVKEVAAPTLSRAG
ncbi:YetF domain-containing protein [Myxococcus virescens]|uniref:YetF domain-containing protein n=1 Tax=Myxococcus virescens TaxID=83456 RepID=UPI000B82CFE5